MSKPRHLTTYTDEQYADMINRVRINRAAKIASKASNVVTGCELSEKLKKEQHTSVG